MSQIDTRSPQHAVNLPWDDGASAEVGGLRRAITNREEEFKVDGEVAPLMAELLARIDAFTEPRALAAMSAPARPTRSAPLQEQRALAVMGQASAKIADVVQQTQDEPSRQRLVGMLRVIEGHLDMKREILLRASTQQRS